MRRGKASRPASRALDSSDEELAWAHRWLRKAAPHYVDGKNHYGGASVLIAGTNLYRRFVRSKRAKKPKAKSAGAGR